MSTRAWIRLEWAGATLFIVVLILGVGFLSKRDEAAAAADRRPDTVVSRRSHQHIIAALHRCPPADKTTTQTLALIVEAPPAGPLVVTDCVRFAHRKYQVRP